MTGPNPTRWTSRDILMLVLGLALVVVGIAGWMTHELSPLKGGGFALIGVGFAGGRLRRRRSAPPDER